MSKSYQDLEKRRIRKLVKEYTAKHYEVFTPYGKYPKPTDIEGIVPDFIAKKGDRTIIIEVVTNPQLENESRRMKTLSKYAEKNEKVRFDIVLTNPKPRLDKKDRVLSNEMLLIDVLQGLFDSTIDFYDKGDYLTSVALLQVLFENILRLLAVENKVIEMGGNLPTLEIATKLFREKKISKDNYHTIMKFINFRNVAVHRRGDIEKQTIREFIDFVSFFIKEVAPKVSLRQKKLLKDNERVHFT